MDLNNLAGPCVCGETHEAVTIHIDTAEGASERMPQKLREHGYTRIWMVCDTNTYAAAGEMVERLLNADGMLSGKTVLTHEHVMADEFSVETTKNSLGEFDALIAVGSGTVHDITRYVAFDLNKPFISFPTAASVDGFVSGIAAMEFGGIKVTAPSRAPVMLFSEPEIIMNAPARLTCAGIGDLMGKYTSLADWRMSHLLTGERFCQHIYDMMAEAVEIVRKSIPGIAAGTAEAHRSLMDGLILSGLAMQLFGNSRAASSGEHHISHFLEMGLVPGADQSALHGEKVGLAEVQVLNLYKTIDIDKLLRLPLRFRDVEADIRSAYGELSDEIIKTNTPNCTTGLVPELIEKNLDEVKRIYASLPSGDELHELMAGVGCVVDPGSIDCTDADMEYCLKYSCYIRNRVTLMRLNRTLLTD